MALAKSSFLFGSGTLLSRVTGLIRDRVMFGAFGASVGLDAFIVAMRIPNLFREMLAEGSLGNAFTKVFSEISVHDDKRAKELLAESLWVVGFLVTIFCALGVLAAPWLVQLMTLMAGGEQSQELINTATGLARLLFPVLGFMVMGAVIMGVLHQRGRFFLTATAPILFNLGYIVGALIFAEALTDWQLPWINKLFGDPGITGLAFGVLLGAFGQMFIQLVGIWKQLLKGVIWPPQLRVSKELKQVFWLMGPMVIAASAAQVNQVIITNFSTSLEAGTVTRLLAAFRLLHLPVALFAVAIGVTALPSLTRSIAKAGGQITKEISRQLQTAVELVLWFMVPCLVYYLANSQELIAFLFQSGKFLDSDVAASAQALDAYALAFLAYGVNKVLQSYYFATNRTKYPMKMSLATIATNLVFLNLFIDQGISGLALAFTCSLSLYSVLLILGLAKDKLDLDGVRLFKNLFFLGLSASVTLWAQFYFHDHVIPRDVSDNVTIDAGIVVLINGLLVVAIFLGMGSIMLRQSPLQILRQLRRR